MSCMLWVTMQGQQSGWARPICIHAPEGIGRNLRRVLTMLHIAGPFGLQTESTLFSCIHNHIMSMFFLVNGSEMLNYNWEKKIFAAVSAIWIRHRCGASGANAGACEEHFWGQTSSPWSTESCRGASHHHPWQLDSGLLGAKVRKPFWHWCNYHYLRRWRSSR